MIQCDPKYHSKIKEELRALHGRVRWVEHRDMIADGLKKNGSLEALLRVLASGVYGIEAESSVLHRRAERDSGVRDFGEL